MKRPVYFIFMVLILSGLILSGCNSSGIHLFNVTVTGVIKENSLLKQPIKDVQIFSGAGKLLGSTNALGVFSIKADVSAGSYTLTFIHPDYEEHMVEESIDGRYQKTVELPPQYLLPAEGQISGKITREIILPTVLPTNFSSQSVSSTDVAAEVVDGEYNLAVKQDKAWLQEKLKNRGEILHETAGIYTIKIYQKSDEEILQKELNTSKDVEYIVPNRVIKLLGFIAADEYLDSLWNLKMINTISAWPYSTGQGVTVAVMDTLYSTTHPDLLANLLPGVDVNNSIKIDYSMSKHGLHVAGIIGAVANQDGILGVAPNVKILPVRVFRRTPEDDPYGYISASASDIIRGINLAMENGAQIINMSFGMGIDDPALHDAIKKAYTAGILIVAASGNDGSGSILYPAAYPEVMAVGAVGPDGLRAYYSQYGDGMEIMAPGGNIHLGEEDQILSTGYLEQGWDDTWIPSWVYMQGTSMAAPHVAGVAALLMAQGITDPDYVRLILRETAHDIGPAGYDNTTGYGIVDAFAALNRFQNSYVFFGNIESGYAQIKSPVLQVKVNGTYELGGVRPGSGKLIGWIDVNQNLKIDGGDYLGESNTMQIAEDSAPLAGVDVVLKLVAGNFSAIDITRQTP